MYSGWIQCSSYWNLLTSGSDCSSLQVILNKWQPLNYCWLIRAYIFIDFMQAQWSIIRWFTRLSDYTYTWELSRLSIAIMFWLLCLYFRLHTHKVTKSNLILFDAIEINPADLVSVISKILNSTCFILNAGCACSLLTWYARILIKCTQNYHIYYIFLIIKQSHKVCKVSYQLDQSWILVVLSWSSQIMTRLNLKTIIIVTDHCNYSNPHPLPPPPKKKKSWLKELIPN